MTRISDLIRELEAKKEQLGDIRVMSSSNYGDICQTEQLDDILGIEPCNPVESGYSNSGLAFPNPEDFDDIDPEADNQTNEEVLVLRYKY